MRPQTKPILAELPDQQQELVRKNHERRITELQQAILEPQPGKMIARQILTNSGVYTPTPGTKSVRCYLQAAGGGGGGAGGGAQFAVGAGGSSGVLSLILLVTALDLTGGSYTTGLGGVGGTNVGGQGATGGDATIKLNGVTYTAKGGGGGFGMASVATGFAGWVDPAAGSIGTFTTFNRGGQGFNDSPIFLLWSGSGGSSPFGAGGGGLYGVAAAGLNGGPGAGGGGASANAGGFAGGNGGNGLIIVEEHS